MLKSIFSNKWLKMGIFGFIGMAAGFAYYYYIGCASGTCPITSNPFISTGYGLAAGLLIGWDGSRKKQEK
jgi:hypothetical protein